MKCKYCNSDMFIASKPVIVNGKEETHQFALCGKCGAQIDLSAPSSPINKKKKKDKVLLIVLAIFFVLGFLARCSSGVSSTSSVTENDQSEVATSDTVSYTDGVSFDNGKLKITLDKLKLNYTGYNEYSKPNAGMKYIKVFVSYENISDTDQYVSIYDFDCYADGELMQQSYLTGGTGDDFINANLSPGRKVSFDIYYSVPTSAENIELEHKDASLFGSESKKTIVLK